LQTPSAWAYSQVPCHGGRLPGAGFDRIDDLNGRIRRRTVGESIWKLWLAATKPRRAGNCGDLGSTMA
jgi:hypothetical protein